MLKIQQKQGINSIGILSLFLLVGVCLGATSPLWNGASSEAEQKTMRRAEGLAFQILEGQKPRERQPASVGSSPEISEISQPLADSGQLGLDLWGHPFHYKILKSDDGEKLKIIVWSSGPNGNLETKDPQIFGGDDIGTSIQIK